MGTRSDSTAAGSLVAVSAAAAGSGGFRLWPVFSTAAFRRKLLEAMMCGGVSSRKNGSCADVIRLSERRPDTKQKRRGGSERLSELLKADVSEAGSDESVDAETRRKIEVLEELQGVVKRLEVEQNVAGESRKDAAADVRRFAKDDPEARETLAMLGAIPPLVGMLASGDIELHIVALYALLNLGIGNDLNKAAIAKAGLVHKMLGLIDSGSSPPVSEAIVANFLGLSALDYNKPIIGSSGAIPFLVKSFKCSCSSSQAKQDALRALFNLSISPSNIPHLIESDLVPSLLAVIGDMEVSDRVLAVISNLVAAAEGRRAVSRAADAFPALVDVLNWSDAPGCQEKAAYILMVMAHKASGSERAAMVEAGIVSALLELTLIGSAIAQKRASRALEMLTGSACKGKQVLGTGSSGVPAMSAPLCGGGAREAKRVEEGWGSGEEDDAGMSEEKRAVKQLVQQSLQCNMRRIVRRANLPQDFAPSDHFKALTATSTSKSLPF